MERMEALKLIKKNRDEINACTKENAKERHAELCNVVEEMKQRYVDIIETATLCKAEEHYRFDKMKEFHPKWIPGIGFNSKFDQLFGLTRVGKKLCKLTIRNDGSYDFSYENAGSCISTPSIEIQILAFESFLKKYDKFESKFYRYVDERLKKESSYVNYLANKFKGDGKNEQ